ncbi:hypothetical protein [Chloroflexus aggregans]|uniref:hypothetical protein n=1 Tax=Chloroflexus aggregans TaxID=152260 RepID=UPI0012EEAA08|nr:hypothetical protein [Chloroflexus aggregans]
MGDAVQWATHHGVPTRTGTRWWGLGYGMVCGGTVGATRRVAPTIVGDPAGRPDDGQPDVMGDARDG